MSQVCELLRTNHVFTLKLAIAFATGAIKSHTRMEPPSKELLRDLECPVCMEYMTSHIFMCELRHNICHNCRRILSKCPTCRSPFITARNIYLENLSKQIQYPCTNWKLGCKFTAFHDYVILHQKECSFGPQMCPFAKTPYDKCPWSGTLSEVRKHIKTDHKELMLKANGKQLICCTNYTYRRAIFTLGEVFLYCSKVVDALFYSCVLYVGPKENASRYKYRIELHTTDRSESASMCLVTQSCVDDVCSTFMKGRCAVFHYDFVTKCTRVFRGLPVELEIFKVTK